MAAAKGKFKRPDVAAYYAKDITHIYNLYLALYNGTYTPHQYERFYLTEPKKREVLAAPFLDRVVHQLIIANIFIPYFVPRFSPHTYACLKDRGVHSATDHLNGIIHDSLEDGGEWYIVKLDIFKFFYSIDRNIMLAWVKRIVHDPKLIKLIDLCIHTDQSGEYNMKEIWGMEHEDSRKKGIPIGNVTSQYLANIYLHPLDMYITRKLLPDLGLPREYFVRYMDDFIVLVKGKRSAQEVFGKVKDFAENRLKLRLNPKSQIIRLDSKTSFAFCGYMFKQGQILISRKNKYTLRKLRRVSDADDWSVRFPAWYGHAGHCANAWQYSRPFLLHNPAFHIWLRKYPKSRLVKQLDQDQAKNPNRHNTASPSATLPEEDNEP